MDQDQSRKSRHSWLGLREPGQNDFSRNDLIDAALRTVRDDRSVEVTEHRSPVESNVPAERYMQTLTVTIRLQNAFD